MGIGSVERQAETIGFLEVGTSAGQFLRGVYVLRHVDGASGLLNPALKTSLNQLELIQGLIMFVSSRLN